MYLKTTHKVLWWTLLLLPIYKIGYTAVSPSLDLLYDLGRMVTLAVTILILFKSRWCVLKNIELDMVFFIKFWIVAQTIIQGVKNNDCIYSFVLVVTQGILFNYMLKKDNEEAINAILATFEIIVTFNLLSIIFFPNGMYNWGSERIFTLIGHANSTILYVLPMAALSWIAYREFHKTMRWVCDNIVCLLSVILINSATGLVMYAVFLFFMFTPKILKKLKLISVWKFFVLILLVSIGIIIYNVQEVFSNIVEIVLNRSLDFTGRTHYWGRHLELIKEHPILGYGAVPGELRYGGLSAHNFFLEVLFEGGIIFLGFVAWFYYALSAKMIKFRNLKATRVLLGAIIALITSYITEGQISNYVSWTVIILATNINLFDFKQKGQIKVSDL